jgi:negative regulator of sigma E activity
MKRIIWAMGLSAILGVVQPLSAQPESPAVIAKQQLTQCMNKRMAADRTVSYNEALRTCKEQLQPSKDTLASNTPSETGTKSH